MNNIKPPEETTMALSPEARQKKIDRNKKYNTDKTFPITVRCNKESDADILAYLSSVPNKQALIKELLRNHMAKEGFTHDQSSNT